MKEITVTACAGHLPCVKKRTVSFEPVRYARRGLDENGWGHGRDKPAEYYLHARNPEEEQTNVVSLSKTWPCCPNTRAQMLTLASSQPRSSHCTQRATELPLYMARRSDHQREVDPL